MNYNFNFNPVKKQVKKKQEKTIKYAISSTGEMAIIGYDFDKCIYYAVCNGVKYPIHTSSYTCKGRANVFLRTLNNGRRVVISRTGDKNSLQELDINTFLPFAPGCECKCDIVIEDMVKYAVIKDVEIHSPVNEEFIKYKHGVQNRRK